MFRSNSNSDSLNQVWIEVHDLERRLGRAEDVILSNQAIADALKESRKEKFERKQKIIVAVSVSLAIISTLLNIITRLHGI